MIACSGHAATHLPQPSHALGLMSNACCHLCTKPLMRAAKLRLLRSMSGNVPTTKTWVGQTFTHSALPSHRLRSITGAKAPAGCLQSLGLGKLRAPMAEGHNVWQEAAAVGKRSLQEGVRSMEG